MIPTQTLQSAPHDGYTLAIAPAGVYRLPFTTDIKWNPATDLTYIIGLTGYAFGTLVPASSPIKNMADYIAAAKARPGQLTYSTPGVGTTNHLTMAQISRAAGIELNHVPYKGSAASLQALLAGHVDSAAETSAFVPYVESGKFRLIAVWGDKRMARFPDVPTLRESGIDIVQTSPWGLVAPKGIDPAIAAKLARRLQAGDGNTRLQGSAGALRHGARLPQPGRLPALCGRVDEAGEGSAGHAGPEHCRQVTEPGGVDRRLELRLDRRLDRPLDSRLDQLPSCRSISRTVAMSAGRTSRM